VPTHSEVVRLNLEYYRKQAKTLLKAAKTKDTNALRRLNLHSPKLGPSPALHDAQLTIAREQGFSSWPRFKEFIVESNLNFQELVRAFIDAAVSDFKRCRRNSFRTPQNCRCGILCCSGSGRPSTGRPRTHRNTFSDQCQKRSAKL
jgi:hypothetical protein